MGWDQMKHLTPLQRRTEFERRRREERPFDEAWSQIGLPCLVSDGETEVALNREGQILKLLRRTEYAMFRKMHISGYRDVWTWGGLLMKVATKRGWSVAKEAEGPKE